MALSEDQRALLHLLLEGEQSYEDISALMGVPVTDVRRRAGSALAAMGARAPLSEPPGSDFLLGQADAAEGRRVADQLEQDEDLRAAARRLVAQLRLVAPGAELPTIPGAGPIAVSGAPGEPDPASASSSDTDEPVPPPSPEPVEPAPSPPPAPVANEPSAPESSAPEPSPPEPLANVPSRPEPATAEQSPPEAGTPGLTVQQKRLLAALVGTGLVVIAIVLGVTGAFGGGSDPAPAEGGSETAQAESEGEPEVTRAVLRPRNGSEAEGVAIFGAIDNETPVLQITAEGLEPTGEGEEYAVWLYRNDNVLLRLAGLTVDDSGLAATQVEIPQEALPYIANGSLNLIDISRGTTRAYQRELNRGRSQNRLPRHVGTSVLRGPIIGPGLDGSPGEFNQNTPNSGNAQE